MIKKILPALFLLLLLSPAFAAVTVTWNTPTAGSTYNNLPANIQSIDMNLTITDNNAAVQDLNVTIVYHEQGALITTGTALVSDLNIFDMNVNPTATRVCRGLTWAYINCNIVIDIPGSTAMGGGDYYIDARVADSYEPGGIVNSDINARVSVTINNKISSGDATRSLMGVVGLVLAGLVLLMGLFSGIFLKSDPTKTAIITVVAAITVAIGAMIIGTVLIPL